jgi:hypothetical protein
MTATIKFSLFHASVAVLFSTTIHLTTISSSHVTDSHDMERYWRWRTGISQISVAFSFSYFMYEVFVEIRELVFHNKRSLPDLFHALLCAFVYGLGVVFQVAHIMLTTLQLMEISTVFYDIYLLNHLHIKKLIHAGRVDNTLRDKESAEHANKIIRHKHFETVLGAVFAMSFFLVRIMMYAHWYWNIIPHCIRFATQIVCCQTMFDMCLSLNGMAVILLTAYFVLNGFWFLKIVNKLIFL